MPYLDSALPRRLDGWHVRDLWGRDVRHDWPWWRRVLSHQLPAFP